MSDSDDTDVLLLIPPNFFNLQSDRESGFERGNFTRFEREIFGNLVSQVSQLETRLSLIETFGSPHSNLSPEDFRSITPMVVNESDVNLNHSYESTVNRNESPESHVDLTSPPLTLKTVNSNTESAQDLLNNAGNPKAKSKETILKEIDQYLDHVNSLKKDSNSSISFKSDLEEPKCSTMTDVYTNRLPPKRLDLPEVDRLLKEMEATQSEIENKLRMREVEYGLGSVKLSPASGYKRSLSEDRKHVFDKASSGDNEMLTSPLKVSSKIDGLDELVGQRDLYLGSNQNSDSDEARKTIVGSMNPLRHENMRSGSSFEPRKRFVSPSRRRLFTSSEYIHGRKSFTGQTPSDRGAGGDRLSAESLATKLLESSPKGKSSRLQCNRSDLLSLAELWKNERETLSDEPKKLKQKLEEEKFRRIHLENTIQELQRRVLEEQEKLAVAVKVDEGKDKAIGQITDAWKQMVNHWREIEAERHTMSQTLIKEKAAMKHHQDQLNAKVERWEKEVSQALDLAAGYKSKCEFLESELSVTKEANEERLVDLERRLKTTQDEISQLNEERKILTDKLNISEEQHEEEKKLVELAHNELGELKETLRKMEAELMVVKEQRDLLSTRLREEKGRTATLEQQKTSLQETLEENKKKLNEAEEALVNSTGALDKAKGELRAVYQSQLETVVKEKLREFQSQLDSAQAAMAADLAETRRQAQERAAAQQQALVNSHVAEMRRLESIHKEEVKALEERLGESERRRERLESGKKEIAHRLHGVMEAQWQQALSIITSELSIRQGGNGEDRKAGSGGEPNLREERLSLRLGAGDEAPFNREGQLAYRAAVSGQQQQQAVKQDHLLKYIQMLLEKQPGKPVDSTSSGLWPDITQSDTLEESLIDPNQWKQDVFQEQESHPQEAGTGRLPMSQKKPPWK